jgi:hypothetical protein
MMPPQSNLTADDGPPHTRRTAVRIRYRLRSLLLLTVGLCIVMAVAGSRLRSIESQRRELAALSGHAPGTVMAGHNVVLLSLRSSDIRMRNSSMSRVCRIWSGSTWKTPRLRTTA